MHKALPIGEVLKNHHDPFEDPCALCGATDESVEHVSLTCPRAWVCWLGMKWNVRIEEMIEHMEALFHGFLVFRTTYPSVARHGKQIISFERVSEICWVQKQNQWVPISFQLPNSILFSSWSLCTNTSFSIYLLF